MKSRHISCAGMRVKFAWMLSFLALNLTVDATTHIIQFGGSLGYQYSPSSLTVSVGDTIRWEGSFSTHPLSSTSVPSGATSFHAASGSTFTYVVLVQGTYQYQCDFHFGLGMIGSFVATSTGIGNGETHKLPGFCRLDQNFPNPFNATTSISYVLSSPQWVILRVYSLSGEEVVTLVNEKMDAGQYLIHFDGYSLASGIYIYKLTTENYIDTKRFNLVK